MSSQGDQGIKGNLSEIQGIPFEAPPLSPVPESMRETFDPATQAVGVGYTPEGLDQNPAFYELLQEAAFKTAPEPHIKAWLVKRAHRRYGLTAMDADVKQAWYDLGLSGYGPLPNRSVAHPFLLAAFHSKFIGDCSTLRVSRSLNHFR